MLETIPGLEILKKLRLLQLSRKKTSRVSSPKKQHEGTFMIESNSIIISDPAFPLKEISKVIRIQPVMKGRWIAFASIPSGGDWKGTVTKLIAVHEDYAGKKRNWSPVYASGPAPITRFVEVDSGQAGIFDASIYPETDTGDYEEVGKGKPCDGAINFYSKASCHSYRNKFGIVAGRGVVSSSGFGDGSYPVHKEVRKGKIAALKIDFTKEPRNT